MLAYTKNCPPPDTSLLFSAIGFISFLVVLFRSSTSSQLGLGLLFWLGAVYNIIFPSIPPAGYCLQYGETVCLHTLILTAATILLWGKGKRSHHLFFIGSLVVQIPVRIYLKSHDLTQCIMGIIFGTLGAITCRLYISQHSESINFASNCTLLYEISGIYEISGTMEKNLIDSFAKITLNPAVFCLLIDPLSPDGSRP